MSRPGSSSKLHPASVLVSRESDGSSKTNPSKPFQFTIPSLSDKTVITSEIPNLFQAERQVKTIGVQLQEEDRLLSAQSQRLAVVKRPVNDGRCAASVPSAKQVLTSDPNFILVSRRQEKNSLLRYIRNVRWKFTDGDSLLCDYLVGNSAAVLYLTLRYHMQCPDYIHFRMGPLKHAYRLRILLVLVDIEDVGNVIEDLTRVAFINNWTMVCTFSIPEAAQYIETFKAQENAPFDSIKERIESDHSSIFSSILTLIRSINKTDVVNLAQAFGSLSNIMAASVDELSQCPGIGSLKAVRIYEAFHQPFRQER